MDYRKEVIIYTDGSCLGNPGPGGYGAVLDYQGYRKEISGGYRATTNNRMELIAVIKALAALKEPCGVIIHSDSEYVVRAMNERWPHSWKEKGWKRNSNKDASNSDLWVALLELCETHDVQFYWVRGHSGHPENERCDALASAAARSPNLQADTGYEQALATTMSVE